ncbi:MAG: SPOR domain-containing protein [Desulfobacterales bacterium]|nr:SPOR domain-containing protein [Desulfobacterales bacterium]
MARTQRRYRCLLVLFWLTASLPGLCVDGILHPAVASTAVVQKKFAEGLLPAEAQAAEAAPPGVVRKKLPAPPAAPASVETAPPAPAAPPPVQAAEPAPAPAPATPAAPAVAEGATPAETKPAETVTAAPAPPPPAPPAAPVVAVPAPPAPKPAVKASSGPARTPFSLLLASCQDRRNAEAALADFRRTGLAPHIVQTDLGPKGVWWRTLAGAYPSLEEAMAARRGAGLANAVPVRTPYANLVMEFGSEPEAAAAAAELARKGLWPYTIRKGASVQLMIGAFQDQAAAESQRRELEAAGVTARTVQR